MKLSYNDNIEILNFSNLNDVSEKTKKYLTKGNIGLSGGSTYLELFKLWGKDDLNLEDINFYPVDERIVDFESQYSNWGNCYTYFLSKYNKNRDHHFTNANSYNDYLKGIRMDTIFLGVGDDGHTASLFSVDDILSSPKRNAIETISPKEPKQRVSLTGKYISSAKNIIIIFYGEGKKEIVKKVLNQENLPITALLNNINKGTIYIHKELCEVENE